MLRGLFGVELEAGLELTCSGLVVPLLGAGVVGELFFGGVEELVVLGAFVGAEEVVCDDPLLKLD
jgi:hypothetical protein